MLTKFKPYFPALLLIPAILSLFGPALARPDSILFPTFSPFSDLMVIHWPKARLMAQSWQAGQGLPHWTPLILSGMPLAANQLAMLSYPLAWLFLILPLEPVFNFLFIFHLWWGGLGVYLLLYEGHHRSPAAALLGSLTFALNGKWLAHAAGGHVSLVGAIGWMPWAILGLRMLLQEDKNVGQVSNLSYKLPRLGWAILAAVSIAMQIVTHTLPVIYTGYLMAAMLGWSLLKQRSDQWRRDQLSLTIRSLIHGLIPLLVIPILAVLLGAAQLLPLLELAQFSNRSLSLSEAAEFSVSPGQLVVGLLLPTAQSGHELVIYLGLLPLLLAPFGLTRKNYWTWFYGLIFIFTILFALGTYTPLHPLFYHFAPGFGWVRTPARMFFVGALAMAVLVGFGADQLAQKRRSLAARRWLTRLAVAVGALALTTGLGLAFGFGQTGRATFALALFIPLGLGLIWLRAQRIISERWTMLLLGLALFLDLASFDLSLMRFVSPEEALAPGRSVAAYLAQKPGRFRVYSPSYSLPVQTAAAYDLSLADGVEPVHLAIYDQYMARAGGYNDARFSVTIPNFGDEPLEIALKEVAPDLKLLGLLNVEYLASAFPMTWPGLTLEARVDQTFIYRNTKALPAAWVVHQTVPAELDWLAQLEDLPDLAAIAAIEDDQIEDDPKANRPGNETASAARIIHYSADLIEIETEIDRAGWLVVSELWYPGWQATVNGSPRPVARVNGLLRGLSLPQPGVYHVSLEYRPRSVIWGNWVTGLTLGLLVLGGVISGISYVKFHQASLDFQK